MSEIRVGVIGMGLFWNKVHKPIFILEQSAQAHFRKVE